MKKIFINTIAILTNKERKKTQWLILLSILTNIADVLSLAALLFTVRYYTRSIPLSVDAVFIEKYLPKQQSLLVILFLLILFTLKNVASYFVEKEQTKLAYKVAARVSEKNLTAYLNGSYIDYTSKDSAVFVQKVFHQPLEFGQRILLGLQKIITEFALIVFTIVALLVYNARIFAIVSLTILPAAIIVSYINKKWIARTKDGITKKIETTLQYVQEPLSGFVESNIYDRNKQFVYRYANAYKTLSKSFSILQVIQSIPSRYFEIYAIVGFFILILINKYAGVHNADVILLGTYIAAAYKTIPGVSRIINLSGQVRAFQYTIETFGSDLAINRSVEFAPVKIEQISFEGVCFQFENKNIFHQLNCVINAGTFVGISGDSGKGKTTLFNILLGFLPVYAGKISYNGKQIETKDLYHFWNNISYVKQEPFMLHDTILNNIVLLEEKPDIARVQEVLGIVGLNDLINTYNDGIHHIVMEHGKNISGGQRQRIAIARALYKKSDVILLDEPFNELDKLSESKLLQHFKDLTIQNKIVLLITHNKESLEFCDCIVNL